MVSWMLEARKWHEGLKVENALSSLRKNGFETFYFSTPEEAVSKVLDMVPKGALVGIGGSVTLREMGLLKSLEEKGVELADHWTARHGGATREEVMRIRRQHLNSDVFITSTNAVTETGELVNVDGTGQRVAAMIFGPKKVIVVAGVNKIAGDLDECLWRASNVASPMNAKRLSRKTPCTVTGECEDCDSPERICNITTIIHRRPRETEVTVILVGKELGY
jgi:L-lactate utilization protein LutB